MAEFFNRQWRLPNAWNGTESNVNKQSNYSMSFEGSSYIDAGSASYLNSLSEFSISVWFNLTTTPSVKCIVSDWNFNTSPLGHFALQAQDASGSNYALSFLIKAIYDGGNNLVKTSAILTQNNWHHAVFTYNSGTVTCYIDGSSVSLTTIGTIPSTLTNQDGNLLIGDFSGLSRFWLGQIDAVSIFNYELSASQVTTLYGSSSTGIGNPMAISGGGKPVAYYPLGDQDVYNNASYLTPNASLKDFVFDFDGSNDYVDCGNDSSLQITQNISISAWFKIDNSSSNTYFNIISKWISGNAAWSSYVTKSTGILSFWISTNGSSQSQIHSTTNVNDGNWHHFIGTNDGTNTKLYIDGNLETTGTGGTIYNSTQNVLIGKTNQNSFLFSGEISNTQIFNTALLETGSNSVETLYNNGSPLTSMSGFTSLVSWWKLDASATYDSSTTTWSIPDNSTNSNTGTSSGMTQANLVQSDLSFTSGYSPYALQLDGASNFITITGASDLSISGDLTISLWFNANSFSAYEYIFRLTSSTSTGKDRMIGFNNSKLSGNTYADGWQTEANTTLSTGVWYHAAIVYSSNSFVLYLNGQSDSASISAQMNTVSYVNTKIGQSYNSEYFDGSISNCSVWNAALTSSQISEIYNEGVPSNLNNHSAYSNLVSWWQLGSNSSFNNTVWTVLDEKGANDGLSSTNMSEVDIVNGVGYSSNGVSSGMSDNVVGSAPYSTANSLSVNMDVLDRTTDVPPTV